MAGLNYRRAGSVLVAGLIAAVPLAVADTVPPAGAEAAAMSAGDLVVHQDHGVGRYEGLKTLDVAGAPHDCLDLTYAGGDKLYLPVENIELVSRYGAEDAEAQLDKLGGVA